MRVGDEILGEGIGPSKKAAQLGAAAMALDALRRRHPEAQRRAAGAEASARPAAKENRDVISLDKRRAGRARRASPPRPGASS